MLVYAGDIINAPWSSRPTILEVLFLVQTADLDFYGVLYSNPDPLKWDWPSPTGIAWVYHDGLQIRTWQEAGQKPSFTDYSSDFEIEQIFGHYENAQGHVSYAVKWVDYTCPTWESDINYSCKHVVDYHQRLSAPGSALTRHQPCFEVVTATTFSTMNKSDNGLDSVDNTRAYASGPDGKSSRPCERRFVVCVDSQPTSAA
ncbi:hypothetical protein MGG_15491 [Pyricularia oryzae 70-15]|uniref:Chromo domain-containing protein n=1 Tax=Pyricularia oryzae (strain 70-15 / ATCC MYA-4617 / FGSC 8958) TaxID=242507 RepID=G4MXD4_PYRO7|nr:uncharacterized protein MGG_15491 [Pyricularia oryzae 70-15]EHA53464.1 hypothetical protein MGG_15491 [Pyricularia oryzae 70-15]